jgi:hypothetical protein
MRSVQWSLVCGVWAACGVDALPAQVHSGISDMLVRDTAGPQHKAGGLRQMLLGSTWRALWLTPIDVPVLDLQRFGGGLTPLREGGNQSRTLHFDGGDGRKYVLRTVRKRLPPRYDADILGTPLGMIVEDQLSVLHPASLLLAHVLEDAAGVLHPEPLLVKLPDDARLGDFQKSFSRVLGYIAERPDNLPEGVPLFGAADEIVSADGFLERLDSSFAYRLDARAWLAARLVDGLIGDFDRGADQWEFACYRAPDGHTCRPVARDRDWAFMRANALVARMLRSSAPRIGLFDDPHVGMRSLTAMTLEFDRSHLVELPWTVWDSVTTALQARLTDDVLGQAVQAQPEPYRSSELSRVLLSSLRARRNALPFLARDFFSLVNVSADIFGTDSSDVVDIERAADASVRVRMHRGDTAIAFDRTFLPAETREIRVYLQDGADRAVVRGNARVSILVRVTGGGGDDVLADSARVQAGGVRTLFYDASGDNTLVAGPDTRVDRRSYLTMQPTGLQPDEGKPEPPRLVQEERRGRFEDQWRNAEASAVTPTGASRGAGQFWGRRRVVHPVAGYKDGAGVIVGMAVSDTTHGFRKDPHASALSGTGYYAMGSQGFAVQADGDWRGLNSRRAVIAHVRASQFESQRFYGFGNRSLHVPTNEARIIRDEVTASLALTWQPGRATYFSVGPLVRWVRPSEAPAAPAPAHQDADSAFGALGATAIFEHRALDRRATPHRGYRVSLAATQFADTWSAAGAFGGLSGEIAGYVPLFAATVALRAGGRQNWGSFPIHEAAMVGGRSTLRGHDWNRFAGDAMAYGSGELRVPLARVVLLTRGDLGMILLADAGRVWLDGRSPGGWHSARGGGLSFATLGNAVSLVYAHGETGKVYGYLGLPF